MWYCVRVSLYTKIKCCHGVNAQWVQFLLRSAFQGQRKCFCCIWKCCAYCQMGSAVGKNRDMIINLLIRSTKQELPHEYSSNADQRDSTEWKRFAFRCRWTSSRRVKSTALTRDHTWIPDSRCHLHCFLKRPISSPSLFKSVNQI